MDLRSILKYLVPTSLKATIKREIRQIIKEETTPQMVYGYRDSSGEWRPRTRLSNTVYVKNPERISIGDNVYVGHYSILDGTRHVRIGEGTQIGHWVGLFTHNSFYAIRLYGNHYLDVPEDEKQFYQTGEITIGRYVFISSGSQIMPGVEIGDGAIIAGGARVGKSVKPFSLIGPDSREYADGARKFDAMNLNQTDDEQLRRWYTEWQNHADR